MEQLISRQAAIDEANAWLLDCLKVNKQDRSCGLIRRLEDLPPAQPKRGKWMLDRSGAYCCSECMEPCATYVMMRPRDKFCKMCGAKMEVTE